MPAARTGLRPSRHAGGGGGAFDASQPQVFLAVYDGHGGAGCVSALVRSLHVNLARQPTFFSDPLTALTEAFAETGACGVAGMQSVLIQASPLLLMLLV